MTSSFVFNGDLTFREGLTLEKRVDMSLDDVIKTDKKEREEARGSERK